MRTPHRIDCSGSQVWNYRRTDTGHERLKDGIGLWLDRAVNPTLSSFAWRKYIFEQVLTGGRSVTVIVRNGAGVVTDLVPLDTANLHVYETNENGFAGRGYRARTEVYSAEEVIDLTFSLKHNQIDIRSLCRSSKGKRRCSPSNGAFSKRGQTRDGAAVWP